MKTNIKKYISYGILGTILMTTPLNVYAEIANANKVSYKTETIEKLMIDNKEDMNRKYIYHEDTGIITRILGNQVKYNKEVMEEENTVIFTILSGKYKPINLIEFMNWTDSSSYAILSRESNMKVIEDAITGDHYVHMSKTSASEEPLILLLDDDTRLVIKTDKKFIEENKFDKSDDYFLFETEDKTNGDKNIYKSPTTSISYIDAGGIQLASIGEINRMDIEMAEELGYVYPSDDLEMPNLDIPKVKPADKPKPKPEDKPITGETGKVNDMDFNNKIDGVHTNGDTGNPNDTVIKWEGNNVSPGKGSVTIKDNNKNNTTDKKDNDWFEKDKKDKDKKDKKDKELDDYFREDKRTDREKEKDREKVKVVGKVKGDRSKDLTRALNTDRMTLEDLTYSELDKVLKNSDLSEVEKMYQIAYTEGYDNWKSFERIYNERLKTSDKEELIKDGNNITGNTGTTPPLVPPISGSTNDNNNSSGSINEDNPINIGSSDNSGTADVTLGEDNPNITVGGGVNWNEFESGEWEKKVQGEGGTCYALDLTTRELNKCLEMGFPSYQTQGKDISSTSHMDTVTGNSEEAMETQNRRDRDKKGALTSLAEFSEDEIAKMSETEFSSRFGVLGMTKQEYLNTGRTGIQVENDKTENLPQTKVDLGSMENDGDLISSVSIGNDDLLKDAYTTMDMALYDVNHNKIDLSRMYSPKPLRKEVNFITYEIYQDKNRDIIYVIIFYLLIIGIITMTIIKSRELQALEDKERLKNKIKVRHSEEVVSEFADFLGDGK